MSLRTDFVSTLERRFAPAYANETNYEWCARNMTLLGKPFSVKGYEFQEQILNDMSPSLAVIKPSQKGVTELQIRKTLAFAARNPRVRAIYAIPTENLFRQLSQTRMKPILDTDKVFNTDIDKGSVRSLSTVQIGDSFIYLRTVNEEAATSTPADMVLIDELDLCDPQYVALYLSRLQNSEWKISQQFGTPTVCKSGIDSAYQASDQHRYLIQCTACGHWNWPEFNLTSCYFPDLPSHIENLMDLTDVDVASMDIASAEVQCCKCHRKLDYTEANKEWVATYPGRADKRGYQITPFSNIRTTIPDIIRNLLQYKALDSIKGFYNTCLGQPYENAQMRIPEVSIKTALDKGSPSSPDVPSSPCAIGIDVGGVCHVVIGNLAGTVVYHFEQVPLAELKGRIAQYKTKYNIVCGAIDFQPEMLLSDEIRSESKNSIMPVRYSESVDFSPKIDAYGNIYRYEVGRTRAMDRLRNTIINNEMVFNGYSWMGSVISSHLRDIVRMEYPDKPPRWVTQTRVDHFAHALLYWSVAPEIMNLVQEAAGEDNCSMMDYSVAALTGMFPGNKTALKPIISNWW